MTITREEWQFLGQVMLEITNDSFEGFPLESAVLYEWYQDEVGKFQFPKTRKQQWKRLSVVISLMRILRWMPDDWCDPYWQIIKTEFFDKLYQATRRHPTLKLNV
ncbi:MAG: hypothetical protein JNM22_01990 [Saprospiraceae bacterium]|nr:hypothetical protein [Saprospiraceae bacterium]